MRMPKTQNEGNVKRAVKRILADNNWFYWMTPANGFGASGISDICAIHNSVFMAIETKFGSNKLSAMQVAFLNSVRAEGHFAFVVDEKNVDWLKTFLEDLEHATREASHNRQVKAEIGARMLNAIAALTERIPETKPPQASPAVVNVAKE